MLRSEKTLFLAVVPKVDDKPDQMKLSVVKGFQTVEKSSGRRRIWIHDYLFYRTGCRDNGVSNHQRSGCPLAFARLDRSRSTF
jgi:hypothetical protein